MIRRILSGLLGTLLLFALTGCYRDPSTELDDSSWTPQEGSSPQEEESQTLTSTAPLPEILSLPYAPDQTLDPITCPDGMQQVVGSLLYEGLFHLDSALNPQPLLCSSYTYDPNTYTYVFTLREGVCFSDGSPLTASDVKTTLDRARTSQRYGRRLSAISSISAWDGQVQVVLSGPNSALPALLDIPIVKSSSDANAPLGTGPYLLSQGETAMLVANQVWWQGDSQPTEHIALVETGDQDAMLYRFASHDVQLITADLTGTAPISITGSVTVQDTDTTVLQYLGCNLRREIFQNAAFRSALSMGFNRSYIVSAFLSGHGRPAQFPLSPASDLYPADLEKDFSAASFAEAVQASGYTSQGTLTLLVNAENSFKVSVAEYIAASFTAAGVPTEAKVLPWEEYLSALSSGEFDFYYGEVRLGADWDLTALLSTGGSLNYGGWSDETTDALLSASLASENRESALRQLCMHLQESSPIFPVCFKLSSVLTQSGVFQGLQSTAAEPFFSLSSCTVTLRASTAEE